MLILYVIIRTVRDTRRVAYCMLLAQLQNSVLRRLYCIPVLFLCPDCRFGAHPALRNAQFPPWVPRTSELPTAGLGRGMWSLKSPLLSGCCCVMRSLTTFVIRVPLLMLFCAVHVVRCPFLSLTTHVFPPSLCLYCPCPVLPLLS